jgi:hypothetical protein
MEEDGSDLWKAEAAFREVFWKQMRKGRDRWSVIAAMAQAFGATVRECCEDDHETHAVALRIAAEAMQGRGNDGRDDVRLGAAA